MSIITAQEINAIAFTEPIDPAIFNDEIITTAEGKYLISVITKLVYDDLSVHVLLSPILQLEQLRLPAK